MHPIDFFANTIFCYVYVAICALFFIYQIKKLHPGKLIVSATLLQAIVLAWLCIFGHPFVASRLPLTYYVVFFSLPVLPVIGSLFVFSGRIRFGMFAIFLLPSIYFLECARVTWLDVINPPSIFN